MKNKVLFPSVPFDCKEVDSNFRGEYNVAKILGLDIVLFDHDLFVDEGKIKTYGLNDQESVVMLRGWMLNDEQYEKLYSYLKEHNHELINNPKEYVSCHYLKNSYEFIKDYTVPTLFTEKFDKKTLGDMFDQFLNGIVLKDYVKSEKHIPGLFYIPKETTHEQLEEVVNRFIEARGKLFNKGVAFRDFVELKKYEGEANEFRVFVLGGKIVCVEKNSNISALVANIPKPPNRFVDLVINNLKNISNFFTVDFAEKEDGSWVVVETGDGQVSGLAPNQNPISIFNFFLELTNY